MNTQFFTQYPHIYIMRCLHITFIFYSHTIYALFTHYLHIYTLFTHFRIIYTLLTQCFFSPSSFPTRTICSVYNWRRIVGLVGHRRKAQTQNAQVARLHLGPRGIRTLAHTAAIRGARGDRRGRRGTRRARARGAQRACASLATPATRAGAVAVSVSAFDRGRERLAAGGIRKRKRIRRGVRKRRQGICVKFRRIRDAEQARSAQAQGARRASQQVGPRSGEGGRKQRRGRSRSREGVQRKPQGAHRGPHGHAHPPVFGVHIVLLSCI